MKVSTESDRVLKSRSWSSSCCFPTSASEYTPAQRARNLGVAAEVGKSRFRHALRSPPTCAPGDGGHLDACIQCTRCVCLSRQQVNDVIGLAFRGQGSKIVFDMDDPMGASTASPAANACRPARPAR
jgi:formate dehydrogenase major subunit